MRVLFAVIAALLLVSAAAVSVDQAAAAEVQASKLNEGLVNAAEAIVSKNLDMTSLLHDIDAVANHQMPDLTIDHSIQLPLVDDAHSLLESKQEASTDAAAAAAAADAAKVEEAAAALSAEEMAILNTDHSAVEAEAEAASEAHETAAPLALAETKAAGCAAGGKGCPVVSGSAFSGSSKFGAMRRAGRRHRRSRRRSSRKLNRPLVVDGSADKIAHHHYHHHFFGKGKKNRVTVQRRGGRFVTPEHYPEGVKAAAGPRNQPTIIRHRHRRGRKTRRSLKKASRRSRRSGSARVHHHHHYHHHDLGASVAKETRLLNKAKSTLSRLDRKHVELAHALKALDAARTHIRTQIASHRSKRSDREAQLEAERKALAAERKEIESERERRRQWREKLMLKREKRQMGKWYNKHFGQFKGKGNKHFAHHRTPAPKKAAAKKGKKAPKKAKKAKKGKKAAKKGAKKAAKKAGKKGAKKGKKAAKKAAKGKKGAKKVSFLERSEVEIENESGALVEAEEATQNTQSLDSAAEAAAMKVHDIMKENALRASGQPQYYD